MMCKSTVPMVSLLGIVKIYLFGSRFSSVIRAIFRVLVPKQVITLFKSIRMTKSEVYYLGQLYFENKDSLVPKKELSEQELTIINSFILPVLAKQNLDNQILMQFSNLVSVLNYEQLMRLQFNLFVKGLISTSAEIREIARQHVINKRVTVSPLVARGAAMEEIFISNNQASFMNEKLTDTKHQLTNNESVSTDFLAIINKQRVAVIGPNIEKNKGLLEYLCSFDVVVFNNLVKHDDFIFELSKKCKIVSYYNKYQAKYIYISNDYSVFRYVDFSVFRSYEFSYQCDLVQSKKAKLCVLNNAFFNGAMQGLQTLLFDLTQYTPEYLYIAGYDLYTKKITYKNGYMNASSNMLYDLGRHDLIGNFRYLVYLYKRSYFECDVELSSVLNMTEAEYLKRVEVVSSAW